MASSPIYVDSAATGTGDGSNHVNAFTTLSGGLGAVSVSGEVLVAARASASRGQVDLLRNIQGAEQ